MILFSESDREKLKLLDIIFGSLSVEDISAYASSDMIVSKLKGTSDPSVRHLSCLFNEFTVLQNEVDVLRSETASLKNDMRTLVSCLNAGIGNQQSYSDFYTLKQRHGMY